MSCIYSSLFGPISKIVGNALADKTHDGIIKRFSAGKFSAIKEAVRGPRAYVPEKGLAMKAVNLDIP
jgi:hypothetical protein